ncbi:MAG: T9SS type A sorting domain-containing protein, partial [Bacteroidia bacterium]|nr:T9SS type A sorting domain-containing protein [Bacteroidia bacterium]
SGSCGALTSLFCVNNNPFAGGVETTHLSGLTIGNTYYIRVFDYFSSNAATTTFSLCLFDTSPPANDECSGALNVISATSCSSNTLAGNSLFATQSTSYSPCAGNNLDDVWYKFTAVGTTQTLSVVPDNSNDIVVEVMSGACSNLTSIQCIDGVGTGGAESFVFGTLISGNNYYFRIHQYNYSPSAIPNFTVCLQNSFVATPSNDNCSNAQTLTVTSICTQTPTAGNTLNATQYLPACVGNANDDVWYKFVATSTDIKTLVRSNGNMDAVIELYDGNCTSLTSLMCADNTSNDTLETLIANNLTIGQTYYLRVYDYTSDPGYPFTITVITNEVNLNSSNDLICLGSSATLSGTGATSFTWSTGATSPTVIVTPTITSTYSVAITTTSNCTYVDSVIITVSTPVTPDICIVTADTAGAYNEIYWEKIYVNVDSFIVYREVSTGTFQRIGAVDKDAYSMYTDTNRSIGSFNGDPNLNSYKYKLQIRDTCGNYGGLSLWHQTVHMQDLHNGTFNWNYYGIETLPDPVTDYEFRRVDVAASTETLISSGIMNTDVDPLYASYSGNTNIKWVVDGLGFNCNPSFRFSPTSPMAQKVKTKSNQANEFITTKTHDLLKASQVKMYPNPAKEKVVVNLETISTNDVKISIESVLGQTLIDVNAQHSSVEINTSQLASGIYFVTIKQKNKILVSKKLVIE